MPRKTTAQLNLRSACARTRVAELARSTGMTATEVVEDALRAYAPPPGPTPVGALVRRGPLLVRPAQGPARVTLDEADAALDAAREREREGA